MEEDIQPKSKAENPLISVIVRTKDRPKLLKKALQSIAGQTYRPIEVVLVNDGGCDLDVEELKTILRDVSLNYQRLEKNTGRAHAGNVGIENAKGEYIGFLDDDDEFYPEHVAILVNFLLHSDYRVAYTDTHLVYLRYDPDLQEFVENNTGLFFSESFSFDTLLFENYIPLICLLINRTAFAAGDRFDEAFQIYEDWDLLIRLGQKNSFGHIPAATSKYIQWSSDYQIAYGNADLARVMYLDILKKHADKRSSESAYRYFLKKQGQIEKKNALIRDLEAERNQTEATSKDALEQEILQLKCNYEVAKRDVLESRAAAREEREESAKVKADLHTVQKELREAEENLLVTQRELQDVKDELLIKADYIEQVQSGVAWQLLEYYRRNIRKRFAPVGSRRWKLYNKMLKGIRVLKVHGVRGSVEKAKKQLREMKAESHIVHEVFTIPRISDVEMPCIDASVSVVIPTKNAGRDFRFVLDSIKNQKGVEDIEIVIVDSGSEDDTLELAKQYGAHIFSIPPESFGHGRTRNVGARQATGDYIIFLSQDAIPIGETCFADMVRGMEKDGKIAAVSARQIPRTDADLLACWQIWNHYENFLRYHDDNVVSVSDDAFDSLGAADKRRSGQIDNIFSCIRKDTFDGFLFNDLKYAEDLDLGLRLLKNGYKIGFLSSVGVIHSHNRGAVYYFKRSYVDRKVLIGLLRTDPVDWKAVGIDSVAQMISYIRATYLKFEYAFQHISRVELNRKEPNLLRHTLDRLAHSCPSDWECSDSGADLIALFGEFEKNGARDDFQVSRDVLSAQVGSALDSFTDYLYSQGAEYEMERIVPELHKLCAIVLGANLGDYMAFCEARGGTCGVPSFDDMLGANV